MLKSPSFNGTLNYAAVNAIIKSKTEKGRNLALKALDSSLPRSVRVYATRAVLASYKGAKDVESAVISLISDGDKRVRAAAVLNLANDKVLQARPAIIEAIKNEKDAETKATMEAALKRLDGKSDDKVID